ncbi:MBL fold metallo-hydrolase [Chitinibacteraceae bacterium HSL-7]
MNARIEPFFDPATQTISYVVFDEPGGHAAIIDPVLDFDPKSGRISTGSAMRIVEFVRQQALAVDWVLETHAHADHLSAGAFLKRELGGRTAIGSGIAEVQRTFRPIFNLESGFAMDGSQFDHLLEDGETFQIGTLNAQAILVPGHTAADMAYRVGDAVFVGDTLFMPDVGSARCDFPGGDAHRLYQSAQKLLALPDATRLFMCHDYPGESRAPRWETTVGEQKALNIHLRAGVSEADFVAMRHARDATLAAPVLLLPSIQINIRAGELPPPEDNGRHYLKLPLTLS